MVLINSHDYFLVKMKSGCYRSYWIGREVIGIGEIRLPKKYWGKRIQFKLEIVK